MKSLIVGSCLFSVVSLNAMADGVEKPNNFWWPERLDLAPLRVDSAMSNPYGSDFNYVEAFKALDLNEVKADIQKVLTDSQDWWPADYGTYAPLFIRMAWHASGTYRMYDGRGGEEGGQQRFEQLNSWPDNAGLDKARRLLWPVKKKYGRALSWGDLMVLTGNVALESMGFKTIGFAGGRPDDWESDLVYWGPGLKFMSFHAHADDKGKAEMEKPLASTTKGLIYVNPEGPNGIPDPALSAKMIRLAFGRMGMNDEETIALIAGGHTFGKAHGAQNPTKCQGVEPTGSGIEKQGIGWENKCVTGKLKASDAISSGLEGAWTNAPTRFTNLYLNNLLNFDWVKFKGPGGAWQWQTKNAEKLTPDPSDPNTLRPLMMFTTDIALKVDPAYRKIVEHWAKDPEAFKTAFARAWFKLTHRDMGPRTRYLGSLAPDEDFIWQDTVAASPAPAINLSDIGKLKDSIVTSGLSNTDLVKTAWASASSYRKSDHRGGANGARINLSPEKDWPVNDPALIKKTLAKLDQIRSQFNNASPRKISLADIIVLAGNVGIESSARAAGVTLNLPFTPWRGDATQAQTDIDWINTLEPHADAFRNYFERTNEKSPTQILVDKASQLDLSVPEMTVLLGGLRSLDVTAPGTHLGVMTARPGQLTNDFFVNLLDMSTVWKKSDKHADVYEGVDRKTQKLKWEASSVDLIFGSSSELRAVAEAYASDDAKQKFVDDFGHAWTKVMNLDHVSR